MEPPGQDMTCDLKALRDRLNMSQSDFADCFDLSLASIKNWEQARRVPEGPARLVLDMIDIDPERMAKLVLAVRGRRRGGKPK